MLFCESGCAKSDVCEVMMYVYLCILCKYAYVYYVNNIYIYIYRDNSLVCMRGGVLLKHGMSHVKMCCFAKVAAPNPTFMRCAFHLCVCICVYIYIYTI